MKTLESNASDISIQKSNGPRILRCEARLLNHPENDYFDWLATGSAEAGWIIFRVGI